MSTAYSSTPRRAAECSEGRSTAGRSVWCERCGSRDGAGGTGQGQGDRRAAVPAVAGRGAAAVGLGDGADDGQAQAGAAVGAGAPGVRAPEPLEGAGQEAGGEPGASVADLDDQIGPGGPAVDLDRRSRRSEAQRVVDQVVDGLADLIGVHVS